ncbi:DUF4309 domain-containing protein, partial [Bacillus sp. JJ664]
ASIEDAIKLLGEPVDKNIPGTTLRFKTASIDIDEKTKKIIDIYPYKSDYKSTFVTVKNTLGKPIKENFEEKVTERSLTYQCGDYEVTFYFGSESSSNPVLNFYSLDKIK